MSDTIPTADGEVLMPAMRGDAGKRGIVISLLWSVWIFAAPCSLP